MTETQHAEDALPEFLITYMEKQRASRASAVNAVLTSLTDRECALIRDAAVMGYVQGNRQPKDRTIPPDGQILAEVVDACLAFPDLYPAISRATEAGA